MKRTKRTLHFWEYEWDEMIRHAQLLGYGNGNKRRPGVSRMLAVMFRELSCNTRSFSNNTKAIITEGAKKCCKGNIEEFVKLASKEWIERN